MKKVNFKDVAYQTRFGIMASIELPTPEAFQNLNEDEKLALYRNVFNVFHDMSDFLTSSLDIDDLLTRYCDEQI